MPLYRCRSPYGVAFTGQLVEVDEAEARQVPHALQLLTEWQAEQEAAAQPAPVASSQVEFESMRAELIAQRLDAEARAKAREVSLAESIADAMSRKGVPVP